MPYIYRYRDIEDDTIKYVGIVYTPGKTLAQRIYEHSANDEWCNDGKYSIEYIEGDFSRTDLEYLESHYIALCHTYDFYNVKKAGWGTSKLLKFELQEDWEIYIPNQFPNVNEHVYKITLTETDDVNIKQLPVIKKICKIKLGKDAHCRKCGSNNIYKEQTCTVGQMYCKECGAWVCQGDRDFNETYTPFYNGKYKISNDEKPLEYTYYTILYDKRYPQGTSEQLTKIHDGPDIFSLKLKKEEKYLYTYALSYEDINIQKSKLLNYVADQKKKEIEKLQKRLIEIDKEKKEIPKVIEEKKRALNLFNDKYELKCG